MLINLDFLIEKYKLKLTGVLHIGAHECEEIVFYDKYLSRNQVLWIEAMQHKVQFCQAKYNDILIENAVVSDVNETVIFNITNNGQSSSMLELEKHSIFYPYIVVIDKISMNTTITKDILKKYNIDFNFVNLDIQGAELKALKGMEEYLQNVDYIYTEVNISHLYKECALLSDIDDYLFKFGFVRTELKMTENEWGDAFYIKKKFYDYIDKIIYINLNERTDRNEEMIHNLKKLNIPEHKIMRFSAIKNESGIVGCGQSHIGAIKLAKDNNWNNVLILEDDFNFIDSIEYINNNFNSFFKLYGSDYDCFQLSRGSYLEGYAVSNSNFFKVNKCSTASGYVLNKRIYNILLSILETNNEMLKITGQHWIYANDICWFPLQEYSKWFLCILGYQRISYSDNANIISNIIEHSGLNMISANICGGLGNQMFQIACMYALALEYNLIPVLQKITESPSFLNPRNVYFNTFFSKVNLVNTAEYAKIQFNIINENGQNYKKININDNKSYKLNGYFQSPKYFDKYRKHILEYFDLNEKLKNTIKKEYDKINEYNKETVSIHVRRQDYVILNNIHYNQPLEYYTNAMSQFPNNVLFIMFSDDIDWCKNNFKQENIYFIDYSLSDVYDLYLMSLCNNNIIANSSFSWWGAYLNRNKHKKVIAPKIWFVDPVKNEEIRDMYEFFMSTGIKA